MAEPANQALQRTGGPAGVCCVVVHTRVMGGSPPAAELGPFGAEAR